MVKNKILVAVLAGIIFSGCSFNNVMNSKLEFISNGAQKCTPPALPDSVKVFRSSMPSEKYTELGTVSSLYEGYAIALQKMQKKAAEYCADGIVDIREGAVGVMTRLTGTAIKFEKK